jgi:hypothetical protein
MFSAPGLFFDGTEGVGSRFHILLSRTRFRRYRGHRVRFSCFALPDPFLTLPRASCPVFLFCPPGTFSDGTEGVVSRFHVLLSRTRFRRYRGRRFPFSCFTRPNSFSTVPRPSGPVFMFCASGVIFDDSEGFGSRFHVLRSRTRFRRYRGRRFPFSCFGRPNSFSTILRVSGPVFVFCAPRVIFDGNEGVGPVFMFYAPELFFDSTECVVSRFHVLRAQTHFRRYRGRRVTFSCLACPNSSPTVSRASGLILIFCAPVLVFGGTEGVGYLFHVLRARTRFRRH